MVGCGAVTRDAAEMGERGCVGVRGSVALPGRCGLVAFWLEDIVGSLWRLVTGSHFSNRCLNSSPVLKLGKSFGAEALAGA